jgi:hypothetical protein
MPAITQTKIAGCRQPCAVMVAGGGMISPIRI